MKLYLKEPTMDEKEELIKMVNEFADANDEYQFEGLGNFKKIYDSSYEEFYDGLEVNKHINQINPEWANQTSYVLIDENGHIYGAANIRHELKGKLREIGGHVGYGIRPSERGKGYATLQLKLLLEKMDKMGIDNALITCRENNIGSIKTMNKFIGTADSLIPSRYEGIMEYRYWVDVKKNIKELANDKKINM